MKKAFFLFISFLFISSLALAQKAQPTFLLEQHKAGNLTTGTDVDSLYIIYGKQNTKIIDLYLEGMFSPAIEIYIGRIESNSPSLVAELQGRKVYRINVYDERFKTQDGIGIGSTLQELKKHYKIQFLSGEGNFIAHVSELSMSFILDSGPPVEWYETNDESLISGSIKISGILVL
jgi:hypothetical protein